MRQSLLITHQATMRDALMSVVGYRQFLNPALVVDVEQYEDIVLVREELRMTERRAGGLLAEALPDNAHADAVGRIGDTASIKTYRRDGSSAAAYWSSTRLPRQSCVLKPSTTSA
jgi:hypothetical protein